MSGAQTARPNGWGRHTITLANRAAAATANHPGIARLHVADGTHPAPRDAAVIPLQRDPHHEQELDLLDWTISNLYYVGLTLLPAAGDDSEASQRTAEALQHLDDTIGRLRDHVLNAHAGGRQPQPGASTVPAPRLPSLSRTAAADSRRNVWFLAHNRGAANLGFMTTQ